MLKAKIEQDLKTALKNKDQTLVSVARFILAEIHNREIENRGPLSDDQVWKVLNNLAKRHRDSIAQFEKGNRPDLAEKERRELKIVEGYLPEPLSREELAQIVKDVIMQTKPEGPKDFGKVMQQVMARAKGRSPGQEVARLVKEALQ